MIVYLNFEEIKSLLGLVALDRPALYKSFLQKLKKALVKAKQTRFIDLIADINKLLEV